MFYFLHYKIFNIIWVSKGYGIGIEVPDKFDTSVFYNGTQIVLPNKQKPIVVNIPSSNTSGFNCLIFPNPANNTINIRIDSETSGKAEIKIINLSGKCLYNTKKYISLGKNEFLLNINLSKFSEGMYLVSINSGNNNFTQKIDIN